MERLHRRLLDVIKDEFDRRSRADINSVQALLLYNIGDKELTAGELRTRGYYLGSNVSYNLKKLVEMGFLDHQRSRVDRRSVRIKLTEKGREVRDIVDALYQKHVGTVSRSAASPPTSSRRSTSRCIGWSGSGPTRSCTGCDFASIVFSSPRPGRGFFCPRAREPGRPGAGLRRCMPSAPCPTPSVLRSAVQFAGTSGAPAADGAYIRLVFTAL